MAPYINKNIGECQGLIDPIIVFDVASRLCCGKLLGWVGSSKGTEQVVFQAREDASEQCFAFQCVLEKCRWEYAALFEITLALDIIS